jgi:hypothetical protein
MRNVKYTWIYGSTHNTAKRIPCGIIEPIEEFVEAMLDHIGRGPVIEPERKKQYILKYRSLFISFVAQF